MNTAVRERGCGERRLPSSILLVPLQPKSVLSVLCGRIAFEAGAVMACKHAKNCLCGPAKNFLCAAPVILLSPVEQLSHVVHKHAEREDEEKDQGIDLALDRGYGLALAGIEVCFSVPALHADKHVRCACSQLRGKGEGQTQGG